jgi:hypothetical protein
MEGKDLLVKGGLFFGVGSIGPDLRFAVYGLILMDQYHPCFQAAEHPPLDRRITPAEFWEVVAIAREEGIRRLDGEEWTESENKRRWSL